MAIDTKASAFVDLFNKYCTISHKAKGIRNHFENDDISYEAIDKDTAEPTQSNARAGIFYLAKEQAKRISEERYIYQKTDSKSDEKQLNDVEKSLARMLDSNIRYLFHIVRSLREVVYMSELGNESIEESLVDYLGADAELVNLFQEDILKQRKVIANLRDDIPRYVGNVNDIVDAPKNLFLCALKPYANHNGVKASLYDNQKYIQSAYEPEGFEHVIDTLYGSLREYYNEMYKEGFSNQREDLIQIAKKELETI